MRSIYQIISFNENTECIELADPDWSEPDKIDMILGGVEWAKIIMNEVLRLTDDLVMIETKFGYVNMGGGQGNEARCNTAQAQDETAFSMNELEKFFEFELPEEEKDEYCDKYFKATVEKSENEYTVRIPFKQDKQLGESKKITVAGVRGMLKRLPESVRTEYEQHCQDLIKQGYMRPAPTNIPAKNYIANFALKTKSLTTPIRLLFTCDQKTTNGKSINDVQHSGRKLQNDLPSCIMNFRLKKIAVTGDISKMYLRIKLAQEDAAYQRTFVGESADGVLTEMDLPTVIFGMKSSPYLALMTMRHIAETVEAKYPTVAKMIRENFYVDDLLDSFDDVTEAKTAIENLITVLKTGNF